MQDGHEANENGKSETIENNGPLIVYQNPGKQPDEPKILSKSHTRNIAFHSKNQKIVERNLINSLPALHRVFLSYCHLFDMLSTGDF